MEQEEGLACLVVVSCCSCVNADTGHGGKGAAPPGPSTAPREGLSFKVIFLISLLCHSALTYSFSYVAR